MPHILSKGLIISGCITKSLVFEAKFNIFDNCAFVISERDDNLLCKLSLFIVNAYKSTVVLQTICFNLHKRVKCIEKINQMTSVNKTSIGSESIWKVVVMENKKLY